MSHALSKQIARRYQTFDTFLFEKLEAQRKELAELKAAQELYEFLGEIWHTANLNNVSTLVCGKHGATLTVTVMPTDSVISMGALLMGLVNQGLQQTTWNHGSGSTYSPVDDGGTEFQYTWYLFCKKMRLKIHLNCPEGSLEYAKVLEHKTHTWNYTVDKLVPRDALETKSRITISDI